MPPLHVAWVRLMYNYLISFFHLCVIGCNGVYGGKTIFYIHVFITSNSIWSYAAKY